jgi:hypothetical protein
MGTHFDGITGALGGRVATARQEIGEFMGLRVGLKVLGLRTTMLRYLAAPGLVLLLAAGPSFAQSGDNRPQEQSGKPGAPDQNGAAKENQHKVDEFTEAAHAINGPAGNPECVWLGRRVVQLMYRDDLDTAFRHVDLYDRFGCPGGHIQAAFRCLTRFLAEIDDKVPRSLSDHVHSCWINPQAQPQAAAAPPAPAPSTAGAAAPVPAPAAVATPQPAPTPSPAAK